MDTYADTDERSETVFVLQASLSAHKSWLQYPTILRRPDDLFYIERT